MERKNNVKSSQSQFSLATRTVFSNKIYASIAAAIAITFWIFLNTFDQILFFFPVLTFYLPIVNALTTRIN